MTTIKRFEDIRAWQLSRDLAKDIYSHTAEGKFSKDFALRDQIRRSVGSIMHNIAEGFESGSDNEFIRFLRYSLRSAAEVQSQLYLACDLGYITQEAFEALNKHVIEIKGNLHGFIAYLVKDRKTGSFKESSSVYFIHVEDETEIK